MNELERHEAAVQAAITGLRSLGLDYAHLAHAIEEKINEALHPKPEWEDVPVEAWGIFKGNGGYVSSHEAEPSPEAIPSGCYVRKLTGPSSVPSRSLWRGR